MLKDYYFEDVFVSKHFHPYNVGIEIWALLTDTLRYLGLRIMNCTREHHVVPVWRHRFVDYSEESEVYSSSSLVFASFWKLKIVGPSANDRLAWNTTANYMDFLP